LAAEARSNYDRHQPSSGFQQKDCDIFEKNRFFAMSKGQKVAMFRDFFLQKGENTTSSKMRNITLI
jgi:hypothetical protein